MMHRRVSSRSSSLAHAALYSTTRHPKSLGLVLFIAAVLLYARSPTSQAIPHPDAAATPDPVVTFDDGNWCRRGGKTPQPLRNSRRPSRRTSRHAYVASLRVRRPTPDPLHSGLRSGSYGEQGQVWPGAGQCHRAAVLALMKSWRVGTPPLAPVSSCPSTRMVGVPTTLFWEAWSVALVTQFW
jgi:hypothetical protein